MSSELPLVLVIGGAGTTGFVITKALASSGSWRVAIGIRPSSVDKPKVKSAKELGVEIRTSEWTTDSAEKLDQLFHGVDIAISIVTMEVIPNQKVLIDAAKRAGVKRFVPSDFGTPCAPGGMHLYDMKLEIRDYIKAANIPHTFIDVGFWFQGTLPHREGSEDWLAPTSHEFYGSGKVKNAWVNLYNIGKYVDKVISDERTLNQYVFINDDEATLEEIVNASSKAAGEDFNSKRVFVSEEEIIKGVADAREFLEKNPDLPYIQRAFPLHKWDYCHSKFVAGHNTTENARAQGALIGKELYPDLKFQTMQEHVDEFYASGKLGPDLYAEWGF